jgi:hypothetical protein
MAYVDPDYRTKKEFKQAVKDGVKHIPYINGFIFKAIQNGREVIEGPHYPKPHTWYATATIKNGLVTEVK